MDDFNLNRYKRMIESFVEQGVFLFLNEKATTVQAMVEVQRVHERPVIPEFIVKSETGEIKEIWYNDKE